MGEPKLWSRADVESMMTAQDPRLKTCLMMEEGEYRAVNAVNHSSLKYMDESPSKFRWHMQNPRQPSSALQIGKAIHCAILEPHKFDESFRVMPKFDRRTKKGKEDAEAWEKQWPNAQAITAEEFEIVVKCSETIQKDPFFRQFFDGGVKEASWFSNHAPGGMWLKGRTDVWLPDRKIIVDLKTTDSANRWVFNNDITRYGYLTQAAFYTDLVHSVTGVKPEAYVIVAVEKTKDCDMRAFYFEPEDLHVGHMQYMKWLATMQECMKTDIWPGYEREFVRYQLPKFLREEESNGFE